MKGLVAIDELSMGVFGGINNESSDLIEFRLETLVNGLQISSQLARNSEKFYSLMTSIFTAKKVLWILTETNATARAKCCNLIGNLCRYILFTCSNSLILLYFSL